MKLKARTDIPKVAKAKEVFEAEDRKAGVYLEYGWAEEVVEEVKAPKAKPAKKTAKK